ncbi:unnamed protein product, partial [Rotaria magnacalcarata]
HALFSNFNSKFSIPDCQRMLSSVMIVFSFGNDANWKYQVFVLDPSASVECPFTGMWTFKQVGQSNSLIQTRFRVSITP